MQYSLLKRTQELVKARVRSRGDVRALADELSLSYYVIYRIVTNRTQSIDADTCQRLYEHLSGRKLEIQ